MTAIKREFTQGPLYRVAQAVYGLLGATVSFLIACVPFIAAITVTRTWPIIVVAGFSIGPAWVALLYTMRHYVASRDIEPFRLFWRGYRLSWAQALLFWVPYFSLLAVLAADVFVVGAAAGPWRWASVVLGILALLWGSTVLMIISAFSFRLRDVLRLAVYSLIHSPRWLLADAALLLVTGGVAVVFNEGVAGLVAALVALSAVLNARGVQERLRAEFTTAGSET